MAMPTSPATRKASGTAISSAMPALASVPTMVVVPVAALVSFAFVAASDPLTPELPTAPLAAAVSFAFVLASEPTTVVEPLAAAVSLAFVRASVPRTVVVPAALLVSFALSLLIGLFSLRVKAIFFAMITLAVASAFLTLASQLSDFTGGEDGLNFRVPEALSPATEYLEEPWLGASIDGRFLSYYLLLVAVIALVLLMLRIVNSPFGRVLQAIRENEFRAEAIGYRVVVYRTTSSVLSALFATLAGCMLALWLRYNGPDTSLSFEIMMDCLLIVVIGGMGSIMGSILTGLGLGVIEGFTKVFYPEASSTVVFVIMVIVLLIRPAGLFGKEK